MDDAQAGNVIAGAWRWRGRTGMGAFASGATAHARQRATGNAAALCVTRWRALLIDAALATSCCFASPRGC
jgi:hypothetical protein